MAKRKTCFSWLKTGGERCVRESDLVDGRCRDGDEGEGEGEGDDSKEKEAGQGEKTGSEIDVRYIVDR